MNDRKNLQYAFELDREMTSIEDNIKQLDEIHESKIDILHFGSNGKQHTIFFTDIEQLELTTEINKMVEIIQNKRRNLLTEKENEFKKL